MTTRTLGVLAAALVAGVCVPLGAAAQNQSGRGAAPSGQGAQAKPEAAQPSGPIPRTSDGKPDMSGVFANGGGGGGGRRERIQFQPWAAEKNKTFVARKLADNPTARCLSPGIINLTTVPFFPIQFVQTRGQMVILYEWDHFFRVIPTDGREQVKEPDPLQSLGHSVGKWEGDTLVVDVVGLSDYTWIDNNAGVHSDALHIVERFTMLDRDTIQYQARLEDPKAWTAPWSVAATLKRRPPTDQLMEYNCAENNKPDDYPTATELVQ